jgi:hypothetical protein
VAKGEYLGYEWEIVHNSMGFLCGYIKVLPGHPWFALQYDAVGYKSEELGLSDVDVHGGLTFGDYGKACPTHGKKDEYWFGFDCGHAGDGRSVEYMEPKLREAYTTGPMAEFLDSPHSTFRDKAYVQAECESLIRQAIAAQVAAGPRALPAPAS